MWKLVIESKGEEAHPFLLVTTWNNEWLGELINKLLACEGVEYIELVRTREDKKEGR